MSANDNLIRLDLDNPVFQDNLLRLQKNRNAMQPPIPCEKYGN